MLKSMTGFASSKGELQPHNWSWELRSVNSKGLDLRIRVPDWLEGLESHLRAALSKAVARGSVTLSLRLSRADDAGVMTLNPDVLDTVLSALSEIEQQAMDRGVTLAPSKASDLLAIRGMMDATVGADDPAPLVAQIKTEFAPLVEAFLQMRAAEGSALLEILSRQLDQVAQFTETAEALALKRRDAMAEMLQTNLARVLDNTDGADADRVAQELALLVVKADVTEEIDRLKAHIATARDLLSQDGAVGRKLDFLMQEFNREANTLCSKSQNAELTAVGLELKAVIDQMREQVQNVE
ncbi:YicC family protein [Phaeobacter gallaeciensis]|uniref:YicC family protein n=2 Tax=Roseobacteraceae TaxID=2854170 RepID=A0A366WX64_9RHOB|nr:MULTISPECIES: YicC/YloC family endoribonuclease [Roseobacteraceae]MBT3140263.1 YicC family protein [Falsiruegeria litorea]MBT8171101.1 YicC family protein [Falsiruegeria litorea]RBW53361.1 YicC family protein [Phaeobacter gallaeciensis]